jgi:hypothetical protein
VLETDNDALHERIEQAEQALAARLSELSAETSTERMEIETVSKALRVLREERF